jgi:hypothetical protein
MWFTACDSHQKIRVGTIYDNLNITPASSISSIRSSPSVATVSAIASLGSLSKVWEPYGIITILAATSVASFSTTATAAAISSTSRPIDALEYLQWHRSAKVVVTCIIHDLAVVHSIHEYFTIAIMCGYLSRHMNLQVNGRVTLTRWAGVSTMATGHAEIKRMCSVATVCGVLSLTTVSI